MQYKKWTRVPTICLNQCVEGENVESQNIKVELQQNTEHKLAVKFLAIKITKIAEDEAEDKMVIVK